MNRHRLDNLIIFMLPVLCVLLLESLLTETTLPSNTKNIIGYLEITLFAFSIFMQIKYFIRAKNRKDDILLLEDIIKYKKKRKEIEEKIDSLTKELMYSDISEYLDINRLSFDGQDKLSNREYIGNDLLSQQFGLTEIDTRIRKDSAVFLTPFTSKGKRIFEISREALDKIGIYVRMTDNYVEKSDILSNIISLIIQSEYVIVNIDGRNPNVYYELGIAHAWGKKTIIISDIDNLIDDIGFDIRQKRIIMYKTDDDLREQLIYTISNINYHKE